MGYHVELFELGGEDIFLPDEAGVRLHSLTEFNGGSSYRVNTEIRVHHKHAHVISLGCVDQGQHATFLQIFNFQIRVFFVQFRIRKF